MFEDFNCMYIVRGVLKILIVVFIGSNEHRGFGYVQL